MRCKKMYFVFNDEADIVRGKNRSILVNIKNKTLYFVSNKFYKILRLCKKGKSIERISNNTELLTAKLKELETLQFGRIMHYLPVERENVINKNKIDMLWLPLTESCNYRCIHCYENANNSVKQNNYMSLFDYKIFFDLVTQKHTINCVQLTGGEPLLRGKNLY